MPGTLMLAVPFALLGNVAWQNLAWWAVLLVAAHRLLGDGRAALAILGLSLLVSPVLLQDFVTGGDLRHEQHHRAGRARGAARLGP